VLMFVIKSSGAFGTSPTAHPKKEVLDHSERHSAAKAIPSWLQFSLRNRQMQHCDPSRFSFYGFYPFYFATEFACQHSL